MRFYLKNMTLFLKLMKKITVVSQFGELLVEKK